MSCKEYTDASFRPIYDAFGDKYEGRFITNANELTKIREELKAKLGNKVDEDTINCYIYKKLSIGELTPFMFNDDIEEIMVIGLDSPVYLFDKKKGMVETDIFLERDVLIDLIQKIAMFSRREVSPEHPLLDGRLPDGSRVNATLSGVTPRGPTLTIRKFAREPLTVLDLLRYKTLDPKLASFLWMAVDGMGVKPANILCIGGTASGKTTTMNALSSFIPDDARIISIEDTLEISIRHKHWIPMETKPPSQNGKNEVTMDALLKNVLRMRPDRIIVGEVRSKEALTLFTAMNTGHDGCLATIHANSTREALTRLKSHPMNVPDTMMTALDLLVAQRRFTQNGKLKRIVFEVAEISGAEGDTILTNTLFKYDPDTGKLDSRILNGKIIQEISRMANLSIKELDEEMYKRELVLELMVDYDLKQKDIHKFVQQYYKKQYETLEGLHEEIKSMKKIESSIEEGADKSVGREGLEESVGI